MARLLLIYALLFSSSFTQANLYEEIYSEEQISKILMNEFATLVEKVKGLESEYVVGGILNGKKYKDHELLWSLAEDEKDYDIIRIYKEGEKGQQSFAITYIRGKHIVPGENVLRRFVGPNQTGWRNDTINYETGRYLGAQGAQAPNIRQEEMNIIKKYNITLFAE